MQAPPNLTNDQQALLDALTARLAPTERVKRPRSEKQLETTRRMQEARKKAAQERREGLPARREEEEKAKELAKLKRREEKEKRLEKLLQDKIDNHQKKLLDELHRPLTHFLDSYLQSANQTVEESEDTRYVEDQKKQKKEPAPVPASTGGGYRAPPRVFGHTRRLF